MADGRNNRIRFLNGIRPDRRQFLQTAVGVIGADSIATSASESVRASDTENQVADEDWPMVGYDAANTGHIPEGDGPTSLGEVWSFETDFDIQSSPVVSDGTVYIGSEDRHIYAIDQESGEAEWKTELDEAIGRGSPTILGDKLFVAPFNDKIYALDRQNGDIVWNESVGQTGGSVTAVDGTIYYGSNGDLIARNADNGNKLWEFFIGVNTSMPSTPAVSDGSVYFGTTTEDVYSINAETGEEEWKFRPFGDVWSDPAIVDNTVYVGSDDENVYAIDADDGTEIWSFDMDSRVRGSPAVVGDTVYVSDNNYLVAIDDNDGSEIWRTENGDRTVSPAVVDEKIYFVDFTSVVAVDAETDDLLDDFETDDSIRWSSPAVSSNTVYIGSTDGSLYALSESEFQVTFTEIPEEVIAGEGLTVEFQIENTAAGIDTQVVTAVVNDEVIWRDNIELKQGETYKGSFDYETAGADVPEITVSVATDDDEASTEVTVLEEAFFEVEIDDIPEEVVAGEPIELDVAVTNTGDVTGTQDIVFEVDGEQVDATEGVELEGDEDFTDPFTYETVEGDTPEITVSVKTDNDQASSEIAVVEAEDEEEDSVDKEGEDTTTPSDDEATNTPEEEDSDLQEENDGQLADEEIPGFSVVSALAGLGGTAYLLKRRLSGKDTEE